MGGHVSDDPGRVPRITFAKTPADPADYLPAPTGVIRCGEPGCPGNLGRGKPPAEHTCRLGRDLYPNRPREAAPGGRRFMLRLTPNGAPPLSDSRAALDRALVIFTITDPTATPEHIAEHVITSLSLAGRVHVTLEPIPTGTDDESETR
jgi:hypothetical protein